MALTPRMASPRWGLARAVSLSPRSVDWSPSMAVSSPWRWANREPREDVEDLDESTPLMGRHRRRLSTSLNNIVGRVKSNFEWDKYSLQDISRAIVESDRWEEVMLAIVAANAAVIGLRIDHREILPEFAWLGISGAFNAVYTIELVVKLLLQGCGTFCKVHYNIATLVVTSIGWLELGMHAHAVGHVSMLKRAPGFDDYAHLLQSYISADLVQLIQMVRLWRLGHFFKTLGSLLDAFTHSARRMLAVVALGVLFFFFSACMLSLLLGRWDISKEVGLKNPEDVREVISSFESVEMSMFTCFMLLTIEGWTDIVRPLLNTPRWHCVPLLMLFIIVANFFLLNLLAAVVVENVISAGSLKEMHDNEKQKLERHTLVRQFVRRIRVLNAGQPTVAAERLEAWATEDDVVREVLEKLTWSADYVVTLVAVADHDVSGEVPFGSFVRLIQELSDELSMSNHVKFQRLLAQRIDYTDTLVQEVVKAVAIISGSASTSEAAASSSGKM